VPRRGSGRVEAVLGTGLGRTAAGLLSAFAVVAALVVAGRELPGDAAQLRPPSDGGWGDLLVVVDRATGYEGTAVLAVLVVLLLVRRGRGRDAALVAVAYAGALVGTTVLKEVVGRPRPEQLSALLTVSPWSFPSGHAAATAALLVAGVLAVRGTRALLPGAAGGVLLAVVAAAAQLVLGLHRPSDLVGGWLWAAAWTTAVWAAAERRPAG
jgi:undecaprenyl-diphosphatase